MPFHIFQKLEFNCCPVVLYMTKPNLSFQSPVLRHWGWFQFFNIIDCSRMNSDYFVIIFDYSLQKWNCWIKADECFSRLSWYIVQLPSQKAYVPLSFYQLLEVETGLLTSIKTGKSWEVQGHSLPSSPVDSQQLKNKHSHILRTELGISFDWTNWLFTIPCTASKKKEMLSEYFNLVL